MSTFAQALIASARPQTIAARAQELFRKEVRKGCEPDLAFAPVELEPSYHPIRTRNDLLEAQSSNAIPLESAPSAANLLRHQVWISPEQVFNWAGAELFLKHLLEARHTMALEFVGNSEMMNICLLCHRHDIPIVRAAFAGQFERCALAVPRPDSITLANVRKWDDALFADYFPPPPYSHLLTQPAELHVSPYQSLLTTLALIPPEAIGFCQVLFQPTRPDNNWHRSIQLLQDFEFSKQLQESQGLWTRNPQQEPSNALQSKSREVETKAHGDKPTFAVALRLGLIGAIEDAESHFRALLTFSSPFLHGGRQLQRLTHEDYRAVFSQDQIGNMFSLALAYRPGFLLNSAELSGLAHLPPAALIADRQIPIRTLDPLPARKEELFTGLQIGTCLAAGVPMPVCIPSVLRSCATHTIGRPRMGKSTVMECCALQDIREGRSVIVLDPHGDLIERLLRLIPREHCERTIYFNPADRDWVPLWNPLSLSGQVDRERLTHDFIGVFKNLVDGWGDRLEHILRYIVLGLLALPDATLQTAYDVLRGGKENKTREGLRERIVNATDDENVRRFWLHDFAMYQKADLSPPQNKLSKLLSGGPCALMLSQPQSLIDLRDVMDHAKILLCDLSGLGSELRDMLGSFLMALLHQAGLGRRSVDPRHRKPVQVYCDEAHRFAAGRLEDMITESRKFGVGLFLAHQNLSQFSAVQRGGLGSAAVTIIFCVDTRDAVYLQKDLQGKVEAKELISLQQGQAIVRIDSEVVRIETLKASDIPEAHHRQRIIDLSHARYCRRAEEIRAMRRSRWGKSFMPQPDPNAEEFHYDEF